MKPSILLLSAGCFISSSLYAQTMVIDTPVSKIFVPSGFDDNDNIEVILHGKFPDSCHHVGTATATIDATNHRISVQANSVVVPDEPCLLEVVPFIQTVSVGQLAAGSYEVVYANDQAVESGLNVGRRKTESPDDFMFATVENASIDINFETGKQSMKLQGHFPYFFIGCMVIREVRVIKDPVDVLVVQPIAELVDTDICATQPKDHYFEYTVGLQEPFQGEGLLHVRTLNGNSINRFIRIP